MLITRKSVLTGTERTMEIPCTAEQLAAWEAGALAQDAFPDLTPDQREFIMTGVVSEEWNEAFQEDDDQEADDQESVF